jgi:hypothetical protein
MDCVAINGNLERGKRGNIFKSFLAEFLLSIPVSVALENRLKNYLAAFKEVKLFKLLDVDLGVEFLICRFHLNSLKIAWNS